MTEEITQSNEMEAHWNNLKDLDGTLPTFPELDFDVLEELDGFVIEGNLPQDVKEAIAGEVYPFRRIQYNRRALALENKAKKELNTDQVLLLYIPSDERTNRPVSIGFVATQDLFKDSGHIVQEQSEAIDDFDFDASRGDLRRKGRVITDWNMLIPDESYYVAKSKDIAFRAVTGL
jgi:hypothetical protein